MGSEPKLRAEDEFLIRSCLLANDDPDVKLIEQEWDEIREAITESWSSET